MALTTTSGASILRPEQVADLVIRPAVSAAIVGRVFRTIITASKELRVPYVSADPSASWTTEGSEITPSDATFSEVNVTPSKLAALSIISSELYKDSLVNAGAAEEIGRGIARDLARKLDAAAFGNVTSPAPAGLGALSGKTAVDAGASWANLDPFAEAVAEIEDLGQNIDAWVTSKATYLDLAGIKQMTGSNVPLLASDPVNGARKTIEGRPVYVSPGVTAADTVYGIPRDLCMLVIRQDAAIETDTSVKFTSDQVAVRGILRAGLAFPYPAAVAEVALSA